MEYIYMFFVILLLAGVIDNINNVRKEIAHLNSIFERIAKQIGVAEPTINEELRNLITEGKTPEAIKRYREVTGLGLKEAKDYVDSLCE